MAIVLSRRELRVDLPFNNTFAMPLPFLGAETGSAFSVENNTHLWLMLRAVTLLQHEGKAGKQIFQLVKPYSGELDDAFHDGICQGLWDADKKAPYNNPILDIVPTMASHFYDPDTHTNWLGRTEPTALGEGVKFFHVSQRMFQRGHTQKAAYHFGLSLHYLTDLTQPMHAANFTIFDSQRFGYHTDFERYVKTKLHRLELPRVYRPLLATTDRPEDYFHAVARYSKDTYLKAICNPAWTRRFNDEDRQDSVWESRVGQVVPLILRDAVLMTAQFLLMWVKSLPQ